MRRCVPASQTQHHPVQLPVAPRMDAGPPRSRELMRQLLFPPARNTRDGRPGAVVFPPWVGALERSCSRPGAVVLQPGWPPRWVRPGFGRRGMGKGGRRREGCGLPGRVGVVQQGVQGALQHRPRRVGAPQVPRRQAPAEEAQRGGAPHRHDHHPRRVRHRQTQVVLPAAPVAPWAAAASRTSRSASSGRPMLLHRCPLRKQLRCPCIPGCECVQSTSLPRLRSRRKLDAQADAAQCMAAMQIGWLCLTGVVSCQDRHMA